MKTAVSIPDSIFDAAERLARKTGKSRSRLISEALREYLAHHTPNEVTDAMNRACASLDETEFTFIRAASRRILEQTKW